MSEPDQPRPTSGTRALVLTVALSTTGGALAIVSIGVFLRTRGEHVCD